VDVTDLTIVQLDPLADDELLPAWVDAATESARAEFGDRHTAFSVHEVRERSRLVTERRYELLAALRGDEVVGEATLVLPVRDNTHFAAAELSVRPPWRRQGVGSALLDVVRQRAVEAGRRVLCVESDVAPDGLAAPTGFAARHGFAPAQVNLRSDLDLPPDDLDPVLGGVEADARAHADGYDLLTWWDDVPDEWVDQRAALSQRMSTDAPMGDVDVQEEVWDAERVRETFRVARSQGRRVVETVAVHRGTRSAVAFTQLAVAGHTPDVAYQWDTLVLADHRGHRLGQLVKAANLRALREQLPDVRRVTTWNAEDNAPMLRVNRELGFRTTGINTEWQARLTASADAPG
jgi:GNAT superfamily N-acetyltransferase